VRWCTWWHFIVLCGFALQVCKECIEERETHELLSRLNYTNMDITVDLVRGKNPPPSLLVPTSGIEAERRTSKRARRASATSGARISLNVSGDTTVFQLKLQIWEALAVSFYPWWSLSWVGGFLHFFSLICSRVCLSMGNNVWTISNQCFIMPVFLGLTAIFCTRHHSNDFVKKYVHFICISQRISCKLTMS
jgi:hypothetical protein